MSHAPLPEEPPVQVDRRISLGEGPWIAVLLAGGLVMLLLLLVGGLFFVRSAPMPAAAPVAAPTTQQVDAVAATDGGPVTGTADGNDPLPEPVEGEANSDQPGDGNSNPPVEGNPDERSGGDASTTSGGTSTSSEPAQPPDGAAASGDQASANAGGNGGSDGNGGAGGSSNGGGNGQPSGNDGNSDEETGDGDEGTDGESETHVPTSLNDVLNAHPDLLTLGREDTSAQRQVVPGAEVLAARQAEIQRLFPLTEARTVAAKRVLAGRLLITARQTDDDPAAQFVLLSRAMEIAAMAGDLQSAIAAVDQLDELFLIDRTLMEMDAYTSVVQSGAQDHLGRRWMVGRGVPLARKLLHEDRYVEAAKLINMLQGAARRMQERKALNELALLKTQGRELYTAYKEVKPALDRLNEQPDDAAASLVAGRFYAFTKGDWPRGLALLAQSSNADLQQAALLERDRPEDVSTRLELANSWWDSANRGEGHAANNQRARAAVWYALALPDADGLAKVRIRQRVEEATAAGGFGGQPLTEAEAALSAVP